MHVHATALLHHSVSTERLLSCVIAWACRRGRSIREWPLTSNRMPHLGHTALCLGDLKPKEIGSTFTALTYTGRTCSTRGRRCEWSIQAFSAIHTTFTPPACVPGY
ncbi:hypothetical protein J3459_006253 [Metarhizium acridum]|uniref:uncharacterized protein n=1 Tax=Metarhizium acridum TaxID=92637 RepID=UPI001C6AF706|nr:hypothetical protein J3458_005236 [Metarhizium acridum]KAG8427915.1 hypothetical protein J3459_006253 [Metarhizium acridum]